MKIPSHFAAGDFVSWHDTPVYDRATWQWINSSDNALVYELRGPSQCTVSAVAQPVGWLCELDSALTATLQPGVYQWAAYFVAGAKRRNHANGTLRVLQNLAAVVTPMDGRSAAKKALDDCDAALASFSGSGGKIKSYTIGTRQTEFHSLADLMQLRDFWQRRVNYENAREAIRAGRANPRKLVARFT